MKKIMLVLAAVLLYGCSPFPDKTTISAQTKANDIDNPTLKASQTFKWNKI
jgi:hypothetical protein|tara:strand:+ start:303 stop:455 length:153 start_codon:yes stop_codon:yes gene_type:complete